MDLTETVKELVDLGRDSVQVQRSGKPGDVPFVVIPNDHKVESLERFERTDFAEAPHRKKANVALREPQSFIDYWNLFHDEDSRIFADDDTRSVLAILDYHCAGEKPARWGQHRSTLTMQLSDEFNIWVGSNGKKQNQLEFAEFVEDNTPDIVRPDAATMLEVARTLQAKNEVEFSSGVRLQNGQTKLTFKEEIRGTYGTGDLEVPETFTIRIPIFLGTDDVELVARLRYRILSGKLTFWYDLLRHKIAVRDGFQKVVDGIESATQTQVFIGKP